MIINLILKCLQWREDLVCTVTYTQDLCFCCYICFFCHFHAPFPHKQYFSDVKLLTAFSTLSQAALVTRKMSILAIKLWTFASYHFLNTSAVVLAEKQTSHSLPKTSSAIQKLVNMRCHHMGQMSFDDDSIIYLLYCCCMDWPKEFF